MLNGKGRREREGAYNENDIKLVFLAASVMMQLLRGFVKVHYCVIEEMVMVRPLQITNSINNFPTEKNGS